MKKIVLFVLLLATALAASAQYPPIYEPKWNAWYDCSYTNYSGPAKNPGRSFWTIRVRTNPSLIWSIENFEVNYLTGMDNHSVAWAKPVLIENCFAPYGRCTSWEFTDGPVQCKDTKVYEGSYTIDFRNCNDGHTRRCRLLS